jgi:predicted Zn-dependent protease
MQTRTTSYRCIPVFLDRLAIANNRTCFRLVGSVLHELGHCFDLGHTAEGIMARGFDDLDIYFTLSLARYL